MNSLDHHELFEPMHLKNVRHDSLSSLLGAHQPLISMGGNPIKKYFLQGSIKSAATLDLLITRLHGMCQLKPEMTISEKIVVMTSSHQNIQDNHRIRLAANRDSGCLSLISEGTVQDDKMVMNRPFCAMSIDAWLNTGASLQQFTTSTSPVKCPGEESTGNSSSDSLANDNLSKAVQFFTDIGFRFVCTYVQESIVFTKILASFPSVPFFTHISTFFYTLPNNNPSYTTGVNVSSVAGGPGSALVSGPNGGGGGGTAAITKSVSAPQQQSQSSASEVVESVGDGPQSVSSAQMSPSVRPFLPEARFVEVYAVEASMQFSHIEMIEHELLGLAEDLSSVVRLERVDHSIVDSCQ